MVNSPFFDASVREIWNFEKSCEQYSAIGGTSKVSVMKQIKKLEDFIQTNKQNKWTAIKLRKLSNLSHLVGNDVSAFCWNKFCLLSLLSFFLCLACNLPYRLLISFGDDNRANFTSKWAIKEFKDDKQENTIKFSFFN